MKLLVVTDYQNDFVTGSLGFPEAVEIGVKIADKIRLYRENGDEVSFTMDTHGQNYLDTQEGRNLPVIHCIENTDGWLISEPVASLRQENDKVFLKHAFGSPELFQYLLNGNYEEIEFVGVVTDICVISNATIAKAALPEALITVDATCCASHDQLTESKAIAIMKNIQINVTNE